jgi:hypothetical protein
VLAASHRVQRNESMHVIGNGDEYGVKAVAKLREHFAEILKVRHPGKLLVGLVEPRSVHITKSDELHSLMRADICEVAQSLPVRANHCDAERGIGILGAKDRWKS